MQPIQRQNLMGLPVDPDLDIKGVLDDVSQALDQNKSRIYTFVNPYTYYIAKHQPAFRNTLKQFDGIMADGIGVVLAGKISGIPFRERISFDSTSMAPEIFRLCSLKKLEIYLVGGQAGVAEKARRIIEGKYPALKICGVSTGYFADPFEPISRIEKSPAKIVICGMGAPKQEDFLLQLKNTGWRGAGFTCGGYLDQVGQDFDYYPAIIDRLNLRFLYRLVREPGRLWRRYLLEYTIFIRLLSKKIIRRLFVD